MGSHNKAASLGVLSQSSPDYDKVKIMISGERSRFSPLNPGNSICCSWNLAKSRYQVKGLFSILNHEENFIKCFSLNVGQGHMVKVSGEKSLLYFL